MNIILLAASKAGELNAISINLSDVFSIFAILIAIGSFIYSIKAHQLAKGESKKKDPYLDYYIVEKSIIKQGNVNKYVFKVRVSNLSQSDNSIRDVRLRINYEMYNQIHPIDIPQEQINIEGRVESINWPVRIEAGNTVEINNIFSIPNEIKSAKNIMFYDLIFEDAHGNIKDIQTTVINEVNFG